MQYQPYYVHSVPSVPSVPTYYPMQGTPLIQQQPFQIQQLHQPTVYQESSKDDTNKQVQAPTYVYPVHTSYPVYSYVPVYPQAPQVVNQTCDSVNTSTSDILNSSAQTIQKTSDAPLQTQTYQSVYPYPMHNYIPPQYYVENKEFTFLP